MWQGEWGAFTAAQNYTQKYTTVTKTLLIFSILTEHIFVKQIYMNSKQDNREQWATAVTYTRGKSLVKPLTNAYIFSPIHYKYETVCFLIVTYYIQNNLLFN